MKQNPQQIPEFIIEHDLNKTAFCSVYELTAEIVPDFSGRIGFRLPANRVYFELIERWNNNEPVPCLSYANEIRKLRARMLAAKTEHEQGWKNGNNTINR